MKKTRHSRARETFHDGHDGHDGRDGGDGGDGAHHRSSGNDHESMARDFRRRFWICLVLTLPILLLAPLIQGWLGLEKALSFPGDAFVQLALASAVFFYGGWPFLTGLVEELRYRRPGMMTLIGLAIGVADSYSALVILGVASGKVFFWEVATLIVVMLLGHWVEMRSVMGASAALEELARLMPSEAHRLREDGSTEEVPVAELSKGDRAAFERARKLQAIRGGDRAFGDRPGGVEERPPGSPRARAPAHDGHGGLRSGRPLRGRRSRSRRRVPRNSREHDAKAVRRGAEGTRARNGRADGALRTEVTSAGGAAADEPRRRVRSLARGSGSDDVPLVGGKNASLGEMSRSLTANGIRLL